MTNKKMFRLGMLVIVLVFGMAVIGCDNGKNIELDIPPLPPPPGLSASNPIDRVENINLGTMTSSDSGWRQLLNSINSTGKYVNLDLSACTMTGTVFNPDSTVETGKNYIVSVILPNSATGIEAGTFSDATFENFINIKSISGTNIITIGDYSFIYGLSSGNSPRNLQSVDFPKATTIGNSAFSDTYLENINFPLVTTIGNFAFSSCSQLKNASFPMAQTIGSSAFSLCSNLESISFPAFAEFGLYNGSYYNPFSSCSKLVLFNLSGLGSLSVSENGKALVQNNTTLIAYPSASGDVSMNNITTINESAFRSCYGLTSVIFPQTSSIGSSAFEYCFNLQSANFPEANTISLFAFSSCSKLESLNIPKVNEIGNLVFFGSGDSDLSITTGTIAPILGYSLFDGISPVKIVRVKIPLGATGYSPVSSPFAGTAVVVSGTNTTANWGNGFRGGGWDGTSFSSYSGIDGINQYISLSIEQQ